MYVSPSKKKLYIGLTVLLVLLIPASVLAFMLFQDWRTRAAAAEKPQDVKISRLLPGSVSISWITPDLETEGWLLYSDQSGITKGSPLVQDVRDVTEGATVKRSTHYVLLEQLEPDTQYYFVIGSGTKMFKDPDDNEFTFTTPSVDVLDGSPNIDSVFGSVTNGTQKNSIVYITLGSGEDKSFPVSAVTNDSGNFEINLNNVLNSSLTSRFEYDDATEMVIFAQGGNLGGSVLRTSVGARDSISLTMDAEYTVTDVFADNSGIDTGDEGDEGDGSDEGSGDEEEGGDEEQGGSDEENSGDDEQEGDENEEEPTPSEEVTYVHDAPLEELTAEESSDISGVRVTNKNESSFTVIWISTSAESGSVEYGTSRTNLGSTARDDRDSLSSAGEYYMHHVSVKNLTPETKYYYQIISGSSTYENSGSPYELTTLALLSSPPEFNSLVGEVSGTGDSDAIIFAQVITSSGTSSYVSTYADDNGNWSLNIGGVRNQSGSDYMDFTSTDTVEITGITIGDEDSTEYVISDASEDVISVPLTMTADADGGSGFDRGIYTSGTGGPGNTVNTLPNTAINPKVAMAALIVSAMLFSYGTYLIVSVKISEKNKKWEESILKDNGLE